MPVMNKMRDSMPVVFAVLAGIFLLMIIFEWGGQGTLFTRQSDGETMGTVNGYKITQKDYNKTLEAVVDQMKSQKKKTDLSEAEMAQAEDQAWDQEVSQAIMRQSIEKMGVTVTDQDIRDVLFENPPQAFRPQFTDSTGTFHQDLYVKALRDPRNDSIVRIVENDVREQLLRAKWEEAMISTVRVTDQELHERYANDSSKVTIQLVKLVPPATATQQYMSKVSDAEIQKYYDDHDWQYKQDEMRKFKFVFFQQTATPRDSAQALESANAVKSRLANASPDQVDSVARELAQDYSEQPAQPAHPLQPQDMGSSNDWANAKPGDVLTMNIGGQLNVVRIVSAVDSGEEMYHIRHIVLLSRPGLSMDSINHLATIVMAAAKTDFEAAAHEYSSDPRSAGHGGDLGWQPFSHLPPSVQGPIQKASINEIVGPLPIPSGLEITQLLAKTRKHFTAVTVPIDIKPSSQSVRMQSQQASIFHENATKNGFDAAAKAAGYHVVTDAPQVPKKGMPIFGSRTFVDWLFDASKGDVSQPIKISAVNATVVAQLTDIIPAGKKPLDQVKPQIRTELAKRKAIEALAPRAQQIQSAAMGNGGDLAAAAAATGDTTARPLTLTMGPAESVAGLPTAEYAVNNAAFTMKPGEISKPVRGENGYYVIKLLGKQPVNEQAFQAAKPALLHTMLQEKQQRFVSGWLQNMKDNATIVDYRVKR